MKVRYMRMILFFDLPMVSARERKIYTTFRKQLTQEGFVMMQQSVYSKLVLNSTNEKSTYDRLKKIIPDNGIVQLLTITERQFSSMEYLAGEYDELSIQSTDRTVVL
jgi:CRISPR-associated endoribonuclease cas2